MYNAGWRRGGGGGEKAALSEFQNNLAGFRLCLFLERAVNGQVQQPRAAPPTVYRKSRSEETFSAVFIL